jgi:hypothetical protein
MSKVSTAAVRCVLVLLCSSALAAPNVSQNQAFVAYAEKVYRIGLAKHNAEPNSVEATVQFARVSFDRAEFAANSSERADLAEPAIDACERLLSSNDNNASLHYYLAMNLGELARTKGIGALKLVRQMEKEFTRAAELNSELDYAGPDRNLGDLYLDAPGWPTSVGNHSKARQHFMRAVQLAPDYPDNHLSLLECYVKLGDESGAQREAQMYFAVLPKAREKFSGEEWASSWADWNERWQKLEAKLAEKRNEQSPHQRK